MQRNLMSLCSDSLRSAPPSLPMVAGAIESPPVFPSPAFTLFVVSKQTEEKSIAGRVDRSTVLDMRK